ncbi:ATP-binding cassette domain-containing protein [Clostridium sp. SM-530-WT-3G]|uniref:ATP-binding cassette domain-containing protein n=1 Tax=Clostridium sp. SM-530-WT-3G TaxID=2725303 RepID=UPI00145EE263|nr:ATP-binding cassette domain-containing protein [Clostridium sp. SM-530-WT-3G]NME83562.1 ATP-binding cassette domain-containing protein [Clostridium sp. SM-530-WT-3G]
MESILNVENIEKYYGNKDNITKAINNISFKVEKGEFVGIMGPSGGQKQRVAAARAIVNNPKIILADEPTGALDSKAAKLLLNSMEKLNKELEATILMVTHDAFTASYANRILFIKDGKIFNEIIKGNDTRKEFFNRIIDVVTMLGGDSKDVF